MEEIRQMQTKNQILNIILINNHIILREKIKNTDSFYPEPLYTYMIRVIKIHDVSGNELESLRHITTEDIVSQRKFQEVIKTITYRAPVQQNETQKQCMLCGKPMELRHGRFGSFYGCTAYPTCKALVGINGKPNRFTIQEFKRQKIAEQPKEVDKLDERLDVIDLE